MHKRIWPVFSRSWCSHNYSSSMHEKYWVCSVRAQLSGLGLRHLELIPLFSLAFFYPLALSVLPCLLRLHNPHPNPNPTTQPPYLSLSLSLWELGHEKYRYCETRYWKIRSLETQVLENIGRGKHSWSEPDVSLSLFTVVSSLRCQSLRAIFPARTLEYNSSNRRCFYISSGPD